jgi:hypothetical protein
MVARLEAAVKQGDSAESARLTADLLDLLYDFEGDE